MSGWVYRRVAKHGHLVTDTGRFCFTARSLLALASKFLVLQDLASVASCSSACAAVVSSGLCWLETSLFWYMDGARWANRCAALQLCDAADASTPQQLSQSVQAHRPCVSVARPLRLALLGHAVRVLHFRHVHMDDRVLLATLSCCPSIVSLDIETEATSAGFEPIASVSTAAIAQIAAGLPRLESLRLVTQGLLQLPTIVASLSHLTRLICGAVRWRDDVAPWCCVLLWSVRDSQIPHVDSLVLQTPSQCLCRRARSPPWASAQCSAFSMTCAVRAMEPFRLCTYVPAQWRSARYGCDAQSDVPLQVVAVCEPMDQLVDVLRVSNVHTARARAAAVDGGVRDNDTLPAVSVGDFGRALDAAWSAPYDRCSVQLWPATGAPSDRPIFAHLWDYELLVMCALTTHYCAQAQRDGAARTLPWGGAGAPRLSVWHATVAVAHLLLRVYRPSSTRGQAQWSRRRHHQRSSPTA